MKNPKMQSESLTWMSEALKEFGFKYVTISILITVNIDSQGLV